MRRKIIENQVKSLEQVENPDWEAERMSNEWRIQNNRAKRVQGKVTDKKIANEKTKLHGRKK